jgi:transposase
LLSLTTEQRQQLWGAIAPLAGRRCFRARQILAEHFKVRFHFTPTYSSWPNPIELWFANIQRDLLARGIFASLADLSRKICKYIRAYAKVARLFRWSYSDPSRRISANLTNDIHDGSKSRHVGAGRFRKDIQEEQLGDCSHR